LEAQTDAENWQVQIASNFKSHYWKLKQGILKEANNIKIDFKSHYWKLKLLYPPNSNVSSTTLNPTIGSSNPLEKLIDRITEYNFKSHYWKLKPQKQNGQCKLLHL